MEEVLRNVNKVLVDKNTSGHGVLPYLPLPGAEVEPAARALDQRRHATRQTPRPAQGATR